MSTMTLEQALQVMNKVCGYAFNKAYGADVAMKVLKAHLRREVKVPDGTCPMCKAPVLIYPDPRDGRGTVFEYTAPTSVATDGQGGEG